MQYKFGGSNRNIRKPKLKLPKKSVLSKKTKVSPIGGRRAPVGRSKISPTY